LTGSALIWALLISRH